MRTAPGSELQLTGRDRRLLSFVADHRLVLADHVRVLLAVSESTCRTRLRALSAAGYLQPRTLFHRQPSAYLITSRGLAAVGSRLPRPRLDLRSYLHDAGLGWLWLAADSGCFGPVTEILSERQLRSADGLPADPGAGIPGARLGVRLWELGPAGRERLHYPDLLLRTPDGRRIALELELTGKGRQRLERIVSGYAADPNVDAVVYLVNDRDVGRAVAAAAARTGGSDRVHVQRFRWSPSMQRLAGQLSPVPGRAGARRQGDRGSGRAQAPGQAQL